MRSRNLRYGSAMSFPPKAGIGWRGGNEDGNEDGDGDGDGAGRMLNGKLFINCDPPTVKKKILCKFYIYF